jgi:hypothetical protein
LSEVFGSLAPSQPTGVDNHIDAEWLFAMYVVPVNPPDEVKDKVLVDLLRVASGFKLQQATA